MTALKRGHDEAQPIRDRAALSMSEKRLQADILALARVLGLRHFHVFDSRRSPAGFPDLVLAGPTGPVIFAELKTERGRLTDDQRWWCARLSAHVWRPSDWLDGTIEAVLRDPGSWRCRYGRRHAADVGMCDCPEGEA